MIDQAGGIRECMVLNLSSTDFWGPMFSSIHYYAVGVIGAFTPPNVVTA